MTFCVLDTAAAIAGFLTTALMFVGGGSFGVPWCAGQRIKNVNSLRQIRKDKDVKSVVLRVNSPGGSVTSSEAILEEIKLLDKVCACFDFLTEQTSFLVLISSCAFFVYTSLSFVQCQMQQPVADITSQ